MKYELPLHKTGLSNSRGQNPASHENFLVLIYHEINPLKKNQKGSFLCIDAFYSEKKNHVNVFLP